MRRVAGPFEERRVEFSRLFLANDVAVIADHGRFCASQHELGEFGKRIGRVEVNEVDGRHLAAQLHEKGQADGRGQDCGLASRLGHGDTVDGLALGSRPGVCDEYAGVDAFIAQALGKQADVVLDAADDWVVVFVQ